MVYYGAPVVGGAHNMCVMIFAWAWLIYDY